jgi:hypothetical protein
MPNNGMTDHKPLAHRNEPTARLPILNTNWPLPNFSIASVTTSVRLFPTMVFPLLEITTYSPLCSPSRGLHIAHRALVQFFVYPHTEK